MESVTIPKTLAKRDDLVVIPRKEYERLVRARQTREFTPTTAQKKALARAESNLRRGKTLSYDDLVRQLGFGN